MSTVVADKGYDSNAFITNLESKGCEVHQNETEKCKWIMTNIFIKSAIWLSVSLVK